MAGSASRGHRRGGAGGVQAAPRAAGGILRLPAHRAALCLSGAPKATPQPTLARGPFPASSWGDSESAGSLCIHTPVPLKPAASTPPLSRSGSARTPRPTDGLLGCPFVARVPFLVISLENPHPQYVQVYSRISHAVNRAGQTEIKLPLRPRPHPGGAFLKRREVATGLFRMQHGPSESAGH